MVGAFIGSFLELKNRFFKGSALHGGAGCRQTLIELLSAAFEKTAECSVGGWSDAQGPQTVESLGAWPSTGRLE
jgi:hypothetical protein